MQQQLDNRVEIIEEGLRGRTLYGEHPLFYDRNGLAQFGPILGSHFPLDLVCIFLGTNNCTVRSYPTPEAVTNALNDYSSLINRWCSEFGFGSVPLAFIQPPCILDRDFTADNIFYNGQMKNNIVRQALEDYAATHHIAIFDAVQSAQPDPTDGIRLSIEANAALHSNPNPNTP